MPTTMPEGTDSIIAGAAVIDDSEDVETAGAAGADEEPASEAADAPAAGGDAPKPGDAKATIDGAKAKLGDAAAGLRGQATDKAREYALLGKDRATETLHGVSKMIEDAAATVDEKVGAQYGDYARQAAQTVRGFATGLEGKDVDELFAQARDVVAKSPAIAIGAAAAIGFVLSRVIKAGFEPAPTTEEADAAFTPGPDRGAKG